MNQALAPTIGDYTEEWSEDYVTFNGLYARQMVYAQGADQVDEKATVTVLKKNESKLKVAITPPIQTECPSLQLLALRPKPGTGLSAQAVKTHWYSAERASSGEISILSAVHSWLLSVLYVSLHEDIFDSSELT